MSKIVTFFVVVCYCILIVVLAVLCRCSGSVLPAVCLISAGYVSCNSSLAVFLLTAAIGFSGISYVCWSVNALDLAPQFAGESAIDIHLLPNQTCSNLLSDYNVNCLYRCQLIVIYFKLSRISLKLRATSG